LQQGERAGVFLPASGEACGTFRRDAEFAALLAVAFEEEHGIAELDAGVGDPAEVFGVGDGAELVGAARHEWNDDGGLGCGFVHS
jgi:hypothetical protein